MTCSLQTRRIRIGTHYNKEKRTYRKKYRINMEQIPRKYKFIICILTIYCYLVLLGPTKLPPHPPNTWIAWRPYPSSSLSSCTSSNQVHGVLNATTQSHTWDPGTTCNISSTQSHYTWITSMDRNKLAHITHGNRGQRGKGITVVYWNKGPSYLHNKLLDKESLV